MGSRGSRPSLHLAARSRISAASKRPIKTAKEEVIVVSCASCIEDSRRCHAAERVEQRCSRLRARASAAD